MPTTEAHLDQAKRNLEFAERMLGDPDAPYEWALTAIFYAAVHLGRALCCAAGLGPLTSHHSFESYLRTDLKAPQHIYNAYRHLKDEAESARYDCKRFTVQEVRTLINIKFSVFQTWCEAQLKKFQPPK